MGSGVEAKAWTAVICCLLFAGAVLADPIEGAPAGLDGFALDRSGPSPSESGPAGWPIITAVFLLVASLGMLVWSFERLCRRILRRNEEWQLTKLRARRMLYPDLTVDEAQRMLWAWEEMTDEERSHLPLTRRVEMRQLAYDLQAHQRRWRRA